MKVIIAHEEIVIRKKIRQQLESLSIQVVAEASNGLLAYNKFVEFQPDIILLSLGLPIYDGISTLNRILTYAPQAICVMMGEHFNNREIFRALEYGATHYLELPIDQKKIERVLKDISIMNKEMESSCTI